MRFELGDYIYMAVAAVCFGCVAYYYLQRLFNPRARGGGVFNEMGLVAASIVSTGIALLLLVLTVLAAIGVVHKR